jgi:uridine kinase
MDGVGDSLRYQVKVVGIYGVGGIGKTTTCKTLCNELSNKYEGKVCHIEFQSEASKDSKELLQKVLVELSRKSREAIQPLNEGEVGFRISMCISICLMW